MLNGSVTDETILEGFRSLHEAMAAGFDAVRAEMNARFAERDARVDGGFESLRAEMTTRFTESDARIMRRFDQIDERFDRTDRRITALEQKR